VFHVTGVQTCALPICYTVPDHYVRRELRGHYKGQKQIWFLLRMVGRDSDVSLRATDTPEFDAWRWNAYWVPLDAVIEFKREVYSMALNELSGLLFRKGRENRYLRHRGPRATGQHDDSAGRASDAPAVKIPRPEQV